MAATGLVLRQNEPGFTVVDRYYNATKREPTKKGALPVDKVQVFGNDFKSLCEMMKNEKRSHYVVVGHGDPWTGMTMPIAKGSKVASGNCMFDLVRLVDRMDGAGASDDWIKNNTSTWGVSIDVVKSLAKTCKDIRWAASTCVAVHIRGCDVGDYKGVDPLNNHLRLFQRLFRSAVVSAPDVAMYYVPVTPGVVRSVADYGKSHPPEKRRFIYTRPSLGISPLLLDFWYKGVKTSQHSAIERSADITKWANVLQERTNTSPGTTSFTLAGLWPHDGDVYFLAHEPGYINHLKTATA
jgi:hypothetical protein